MFQHTAARRRLGGIIQARYTLIPSFNTQQPEGGWGIIKVCNTFIPSFNTQQPEGGW